MQSTSSRKPQRYADISLMRITAMLAVIFLHTNSAVVDQAAAYSLHEQHIFLMTLLKQLMNWAVPVHFMITGALMLRPDKPLFFGLCMRKYAKRILLALFIFGVPFSLMEMFLEYKALTPGMLGHAVFNVIIGQSWDHLWYLYALLGVYLLLPMFKRFTDAAPRSDLRAIIIVLLLFQFGLPLLQTKVYLPIAVEMPIVSTSVTYLLLGRYLRDGLPGLLRSKMRCLLCLAASCALAVYVFSVSGSEYLLGFFAPVLAVLVFALFQDLTVPEHLNAPLWKLDRLCFGVYLVHPVFINFAYKFLHITPASFGAYPMMILVFFAAFSLLSFAASWIMALIPPLKKYVL